MDRPTRPAQGEAMALRRIFQSGLRPRRAAAIAIAALLALIAAAVVVMRSRAEQAALVRADADAIAHDPMLTAAALRTGRGVFADRCASCHGEDGRGAGKVGMVDLTRAERLYGAGLVSEIEQIVRHGIRSGDSRGWNLADMPAFATARPYARYAVAPLSPRDVTDVTQYVLDLGGRATDRAAAGRGQAIYAGRGQCYDCHQADAQGDTAIGAPNLADTYWIYGGTPAAVYRSIAVGRAGFSPTFKTILSPAEQRAVAVYAASLIRTRQGPAR